jgi:TolB protein
MRRLLLAILALTLAAPTAALAQRVYIDISGATFRPYPLAIPRVHVEGDVDDGGRIADLVTSRVRYNLEISGLFQVLDPRSFLARPDEGITAATIRFDDWSNVGAEGLLKAQLTPGEDGRVNLEVRLFHVTTAEEAARWTYSLPKDDARSLAHLLANDVVRYFTRERGIFDTRLAFVREIGGNKELWVADWDGHGARRVVGGELNLFPTWAPSGDRLAFTSYREGGPDLYVTDLGGRVRSLVSGDPMFHGPAWSPDGTRIVYTRTQHGTADVWVVGADGSGARRLTHYDGVIDTSPAWSPDGRQIAFVSNRHGNPHIFVMNADGSEQARITYQGNYNQTPKWSPRGDAIVFMGRDERAVFDLFTVNPETKEIRRLTQDSGQNFDPSWSPNGRHIIFTSTRTGQPRLWIMNSDGTGQRQLELPPGNYTNAAWGPFPEPAQPTAGSG